MELSKYCIPKKACQGLVHWKLPERQREKNCIPCKKHGGPFKSHNTCECHCENKDSTLIKNCGGTSRLEPMKKRPKGANFVQLMRTKIKKALYKHTCKDEKCCTCELDSDSNSNDST